MTDQQERIVVPTNEAALQETVRAGVNSPEAAPSPEAAAAPAASPPAEEVLSPENVESRHWHAEAGRKGARRVHQLIQEGKLYEQEHGLKSGRQRLRQLVELGKLYEQEHGLRPSLPKKRRVRVSRREREELLTTLLHGLVRLAKPSFRADLVRLVEALQAGKQGHAA
jgi:hypothetical protein